MITCTLTQIYANINVKINNHQAKSFLFSMSCHKCHKLSASCDNLLLFSAVMKYGISFLMLGHVRIHSIKSERQFFRLVFHVALISTILKAFF